MSNTPKLGSATNPPMVDKLDIMGRIRLHSSTDERLREIASGNFPQTITPEQAWSVLDRMDREAKRIESLLQGAYDDDR